MTGKSEYLIRQVRSLQKHHLSENKERGGNKKHLDQPGMLLSSGAKIDFHFLQAKGLDKTLKMKRLLI